MPVISYHLKIIAGAQAGTVYELNNGEHIIGRASDCSIVLNLPGVSKKHARIIVADRTIYIEDMGSSNGTFVNGIFVSRKNLSVGDKVVFPGIVLVLGVGVKEDQRALSATGTDGGVSSMLSDFQPQQQQPLDVGSLRKSATFKERAQAWFLKHVQPWIDEIVRRYDWKTVMLASLGIFAVAITSLVSLRFVLLNHFAISEEVKKRGVLLAKRMAEMNTPHIQNNDQTLLNIEETLKEPGVIEAMITTTDGKIIAPASRYGSPVPDGDWLAAARSESDRDSVVPVVADGSLNSFVVSRPIARLDQRQGKMVAAAMALVKVGIDGQTLHWTESLNIVFTTLIMAAVLILLAFVVIYRMTAQPFMDMNDEIEQVLKGTRQELRVPVRFTELETLVRSFNFLLNKVMGEAQKSMALVQQPAQPGVSHPIDLCSEPSYKFMVENAMVPILVLLPGQRIGLMSKAVEKHLMIPPSAMGQAIVDSCENQTILGNILEADKEARALNGLPFEITFDVFGRNYQVRAIAAFDEMGEHLRTALVFEEKGNE